MATNKSFQARAEKFRKILKDEGLKLAIAYHAPGSVFVSHRYPFFTLTDFKPVGAHNFVMFPTEGQAKVMVSYAPDVWRAKRESKVKDVQLIADPVDAVSAYIKKAGLRPKDVGFMGGEFMEPAVRKMLDEALGFKLRDVDVIFDGMGVDEEGLELVRKAAAIADAILTSTVKFARPGMTEYEVMAHMDYVSKMNGADDNFLLLSSGKHNMSLHWPANRILQKNDIVILEISPVRHLQSTQLCRAFTLGEPSELLKEKYAMLTRAFEESAKTLHAGSEASDIAVAQDRVITEAGYGEYCRPPYMRTRGHGFNGGWEPVGLTITKDTKIKLPEGIALMLQPNQYLPETGYLACGQTVVVTKTGYESVNKTESIVYAGNSE